MNNPLKRVNAADNSYAAINWCLIWIDNAEFLLQRWEKTFKSLWVVVSCFNHLVWLLQSCWFGCFRSYWFDCFNRLVWLLLIMLIWHSAWHHYACRILLCFWFRSLESSRFQVTAVCCVDNESIGFHNRVKHTDFNRLKLLECKLIRILVQNRQIVEYFQRNARLQAFGTMTLMAMAFEIKVLWHPDTEVMVNSILALASRRIDSSCPSQVHELFRNWFWMGWCWIFVLGGYFSFCLILEHKSLNACTKRLYAFASIGTPVRLRKYSD